MRGAVRGMPEKEYQRLLEHAPDLVREHPAFNFTMRNQLQQQAEVSPEDPTAAAPFVFRRERGAVFGTSSPVETDLTVCHVVYPGGSLFDAYDLLRRNTSESSRTAGVVLEVPDGRPSKGPDSLTDFLTTAAIDIPSKPIAFTTGVEHLQLLKRQLLPFDAVHRFDVPLNPIELVDPMEGLRQLKGFERPAGAPKPDWRDHDWNAMPQRSPSR